MPSYNTAKYIEYSIKSVLNQTYKNWELIIIDDCSTDQTDEVAKKFLGDNRIKYYKNNVNSGAAISRNRALRLAKGRWIAFLDSDDIWHKRKLEYQIKFMMENNYHFTYTNYEEIDEKNNRLGRYVTGLKKINKSLMYAYCWPGCLTVMYDRYYIGDVQIKDIKKNNDYAMWLKVIEKSDCYLLDKRLALYRKRSGSISNHKYVDLIKWHYKLFNEVYEKRTVESVVLTANNIFFGIVKKLLFVIKLKGEFR